MGTFIQKIDLYWLDCGLALNTIGFFFFLEIRDKNT